jgi:hypothetical protein
MMASIFFIALSFPQIAGQHPDGPRYRFAGLVPTRRETKNHRAAMV